MLLETDAYLSVNNVLTALHVTNGCKFMCRQHRPRNFQKAFPGCPPRIPLN